MVGDNDEINVVTDGEDNNDDDDVMVDSFDNQNLEAPFRNLHNPQQRREWSDGLDMNDGRPVEYEQSLVAQRSHVDRGTQQSNGAKVGIEWSAVDTTNPKPFSLHWGATKQRSNQSIPIRAASTAADEDCKNVAREISILRQLDHPNVIELLDIIQSDQGSTYLVFEFVAHDLNDFMDQQRTSEHIHPMGLAVPVLRSFMRQLLSAVECCHSWQILHRDLKPSNILISADGNTLKLSGFGLACLADGSDGSCTVEGVENGWYCAPEILLGANHYSTSADNWSIGCIFAEMVIGTPLFEGRFDMDQLFTMFQEHATLNNDVWSGVVSRSYFQVDLPQWLEHPTTLNTSVDSKNVTNLLTDLLQNDPDRRIACNTALQHPFFVEHVK